MGLELLLDVGNKLDAVLLLENIDEEVVSTVLELDAPDLELRLEVVEELELEDTKFGFWYMLRRVDPPQYSDEFPAQA